MVRSTAGRLTYVSGVNAPLHIDLAQYPARMRWFMAIGWLIIAAKCVLVWWAIDHWHVQLNPLWVIGPTVMFAALITLIWVTHQPE